MAARKYGAFQQLRDSVSPVTTGVSDPENGINSIIFLQFIDFHGGSAVEQDNNLSETLFLDPVDKVALIVGQRQDIPGRRIRKLIRIAEPLLTRIKTG